jgi:thioredoxin-related protein
MSTLDTTRFSITAVSFDTDSISYTQAIKDLGIKNSFKHLYNFKNGYSNNKLAKEYNITKTPTLMCIDSVGNRIAEGNEAFRLLASCKKVP